MSKDLEQQLEELIGKIDNAAEVNQLRAEIENLKKQLKQPQPSLTNFKPGVLLVELCDPYFKSGYARQYSHRDVEITGKEGTIYLSTELLRFDYGDDTGPEYRSGLCRRNLPGGNYTVKATVCGETQSRKVTVDGDTYLVLNFKTKFE